MNQLQNMTRDFELEKRIKDANAKYGWNIKYDHNNTVCLCDKSGSDYDHQTAVLWPKKKQLSIFA